MLSKNQGVRNPFGHLRRAQTSWQVTLTGAALMRPKTVDSAALVASPDARA